MKKFITIMVLALAAMLMVSCLGFNLATVQSVEFETAPKSAYTLTELENQSFSVNLKLHMTDGNDKICTASIKDIKSGIEGNYDVEFSANDLTLTATANIAKKANMENWYVLTITFDTFVTLTHEFYAADNLDLYYFADVDEEKDIYYIETAQQLSNIRMLIGTKDSNGNLINDGTTGKTFELRKDIDISNMQWTPIGNGHRNYTEYKTFIQPFTGTFDGKGHTINGLTNKDYAPDAKFIGKNIKGENDFGYGLFGCTDGATIKNLTLTNVNINLVEKFYINGIDGPVSSGAVGALIGQAFNNLKLENVNVDTSLNKSTIKGCDAVSGLVGRLYQRDLKADENSVLSVLFNNCNNYADVTVVANTEVKATGFIGWLSTIKSKLILELNNCTNYGNIINNVLGGIYQAGFIAGQDILCIDGSKIIMTNCKNVGNLVDNGNHGSSYNGMAQFILLYETESGELIKARNELNNLFINNNYIYTDEKGTTVEYKTGSAISTISIKNCSINNCGILAFNNKI